MHQRSFKGMEGLARHVYSEMEEDNNNNSLEQGANDIISQSPMSYGDTCTLNKGI